MARTLGKYSVVAELARGGMGNVLLALTQGPGGFQKLVVLKELKAELALDDDFVKMFLDEARLTARLQHPNVVATHEVGEEQGRPFLVMDYLDGCTLSHLLRRRPEDFSLLLHLRVIAEALRGLEYAHGLAGFDGRNLGVVHRDMTPQNVFITFEGQVKILDFGIAKARDSSVETQAGVVKGKPSYMSPEQIQGRAEARSDVFAVGVLLWEAVARRKLWGTRADTEILAALIQGKIPSLSEAAPEADPDLVAIVDCALQPAPELRTPSARELRLSLDRWLNRMGAPDVQQVGEVASRAFASEREKMRERIDQAMRDARSGDSQSALPVVRLDALEGTPSGLRTPGQVSLQTPMSAVPMSVQPSSSRPRGALQVAAVLVAFAAGASLFALRPVPAPAPPAAPAAASAPAAATAPAEPAASAQPAPTQTAAAAPPEPAASAAKEGATKDADKDGSTKEGSGKDGSGKDGSGKEGKRRVRSGGGAAPAATAAPAPNCNPPFYFEGTKKVFKPGCL